MEEIQSSDQNDLFDEAYEIKRRKQYSHREVGLNHPDNHGFVKIGDDGTIEIFAAPGVGIMINPNTRAVSIFADQVKIYSKEDDGLRWNSMSFNPASNAYNEPALIKTNVFANNPAYYNSVQYLDNLEELEEEDNTNIVTIDGKYGLRGLESPIKDNLKIDNEKVLSEAIMSLVNSFATKNSAEDVSSLIKYLKLGYSFSDSVQKVKNKDENLPEDMEDFPWIRNDI